MWPAAITFRGLLPKGTLARRYGEPPLYCYSTHGELRSRNSKARGRPWQHHKGCTRVHMPLIIDTATRVYRSRCCLYLAGLEVR